jgi:hypothetical protein
MARTLEVTDTAIVTREYGKTVIASRFRAEVFDGRGTAHIIDKVTEEFVTTVYGVHTEAEALEAFHTEYR